MHSKYLFLLSILLVIGCTPKQQNINKSDNKIVTLKPKRFFSDDSFWNQPIATEAEIDPQSEKWIKMLELEPTKENFSTSFSEWTVPVYEVNENTKYVHVKNHKLSENQLKIWIPKTTDHFKQGPDYNPVPIPQNSSPDSEEDAHYAVVDWNRMLAWDMWGLQQLKDGTWESNTGMIYRLDGDGVFSGKELGYVDNESVHFHGPSRAAGVPAIAGLIRYDEVLSGEIKHKLSCATRFAAKQTFVYPASWSDGFVEGGIPEGAVIQLDPNLDLKQFELTKEEIIVAKAIQKYGMVIVDIAQGQPIYAEGLWGHPDKSWEGKLREWKKQGIAAIPYKHYRILKVENPVYKGDIRTSLSSHRNVWLPDSVQVELSELQK
jgi:hypothetical protein